MTRIMASPVQNMEYDLEWNGNGPSGDRTEEIE